MILPFINTRHQGSMSLRNNNNGGFATPGYNSTVRTKPGRSQVTTNGESAIY